MSGAQTNGDLGRARLRFSFVHLFPFALVLSFVAAVRENLRLTSGNGQTELVKQYRALHAVHADVRKHTQTFGVSNTEN